MRSEAALAHLTAREKDWVTNKASLTARLRQLTQNEIKLTVFYDNWGNPDTASREALKISADEKTWVRRIEWHFKNNIWLTCHVVIPASSITLETHGLTLIGQGAIGDALFQDNTLQRSDFTFSKTSNNAITRHSILIYKKKPLLIVETFLPAFFEAIRMTQHNRLC